MTSHACRILKFHFQTELCDAVTVSEFVIPCLQSIWTRRGVCRKIMQKNALSVSNLTPRNILWTNDHVCRITQFTLSTWFIGCLRHQTGFQVGDNGLYFHSACSSDLQYALRQIPTSPILNIWNTSLVNSSYNARSIKMEKFKSLTLKCQHVTLYRTVVAVVGCVRCSWSQVSVFSCNSRPPSDNRVLHTPVGAAIEWAIVRRFSDRLVSRKWLIESETKF